MLILGIGNKARHGKDTFAEAIKHYYETNHYNGFGAPPVRVGIYKFATALYQEVNTALSNWDKNGRGSFKHVLGVPNYETHEWEYVEVPDWVQPDPNPEISELAPYGKHPKLLQWWGTEFRRAQDVNYWTKKLFVSIPANLDIALVSDTRFPNEADGVKQHGGYTINVQRLRKDGTPYFSKDRPVDHPSETALDSYNWDFRITNPEGHQALLGEVAITYAEYLRELGPSK